MLKWIAQATQMVSGSHIPEPEQGSCWGIDHRAYIQDTVYQPERYEWVADGGTASDDRRNARYRYRPCATGKKHTTRFSN